MITCEVMAKSMLTRSKLPASDYCINPYVGCAHGCVYCYARFMRRFTGHNEEWGEFVDVRVNAPEVLATELRGPKNGTVLLGSVTDCYQPLERRYQLTRRVLQVLSRSALRVSILTKSSLVTRDADLLAEMCGAEVGLTITSLDDETSRKLEPRASLSSQRIAALASLKAHGIRTYAFIGPIFPQLTDVAGIVGRIAGQVDFVMAESLNVSCGNWGRVQEALRMDFPGVSEPFEREVRSREYWNGVESETRDACQRHGVELAGFFRHERLAKGAGFAEGKASIAGES